MDTDKLKDNLKLKRPQVQRAIAQSNRDIKAGRTRPAEDLLAELRGGKSRSSKRRHK